MKNFSDFGIVAPVEGFIGDSISVYKVLNRSIIVHKYKITASRYPDKGNGKLLTMQISIGENKHVIFTGSSILQDMIAKVLPMDFPFTTTIIKENDRYEFK